MADPAAERAKDLIQRHFGPCTELDRRSVGDITYAMTWEGWAYLATVIDLASRRGVGWALADHRRTELIEDALEMAFLARRPPKGVLFNSDRLNPGSTRAWTTPGWPGRTASSSRSGWPVNAGTRCWCHTALLCDGGVEARLARLDPILFMRRGSPGVGGSKSRMFFSLAW